MAESIPQDKKNEPNKDPMGNEASSQFLIVGIGASAGGIKALKEFFQHVAPDSNMAYVVILHLSPDFESRLAEILQTSTSIPVTQIRNEKVKVEPNNVYVIPPNKSLTMVDSFLALSPIQSYEERRAPVDIFFRTLADSNDSRAVAVILSGSGANGSMGMKRVKEMGGIVIVQDPNEAEFGDMPLNSISQGFVDFILPVRNIPSKIIHYRDYLKDNNIFVKQEQQAKEDDNQSALHDIFMHLRIKTGHDFSNYKQATILRRLERRMSVHEKSSLTAYARLLKAVPEEAQILLKDLLISVTNFFRDRSAFEALEQNILRNLFSNRTKDDTIRIWVAGCATGEEAFSLAMLCTERTDIMVDAPAVQIFATDIDEAALVTARHGFYTNSDVADVSPERLRRFFIKEGTGFRIKRELREMVLFAHHNVLKDPPFSRLDLVSCRNLLIYLNRNAQARVMETFHFALNPGAYLFLGSSESVDTSGDLYVAVDREHCIFQSRAVASRPVLHVPELSIARPTKVHDTSIQTPTSRAIEKLSLAALHQHLLEAYAPPSVLVNQDYDIVHLSESVGRYLQITGGEPSYNLLKVVRPELRLELRGLLYSASQKRTEIRMNGLPVRLDDSEKTVNIIIRPIAGEMDTARGFLLVLFEQAERSANQLVTLSQTSDIGPATRHLENELVHVRAQLRSTAEQYEVQTEELRASNEELQAINEELRSAAEELETSKEELQSVNEELTTLNQEFKIKIDELSQANNDFQNLIQSSDIGHIFLDRSLSIKLFTPASKAVFNLIPTDIGRSLSDITHKLSNFDVVTDAELVLQTLQSIEHELQTDNGHTFLMRISPYRTADDRINGVILTFIDITARKKSEEALRASEERFRIALDAAELAAWDWDIESDSISWNRQHYTLLGVEAKDNNLQTMDYFISFVHPEDKDTVKNKLEDALREGDMFEAEFRVIRADNNSISWMHGLGRVVEHRKGQATRMTGVMHDITRQKILQEKKDEFVNIASHELKTPVTSIKAYAEILRDIFIEAGDPQSVSLIEKMGKQVDSLTTLIRDLLDTARITEGQLILNKDNFDLNDLIRNVAEMLQPTTSQQTIQLSLNTLPQVYGDREQIGRVIINLLSNAIKYAPGTDRIAIRSYTEHKQVIVCIQDFGMGLADDIKEKVFERFFRANDAVIDTFPGLGLGLYIASEIVKAHEGRIWVDSEKGKGTTFCFSLPV